MGPSGVRKGEGRESTPPHLTIAKKMKLFFYETNRVFFVRSLPTLLPVAYHVFFGSVQLSNLISRNFHYVAMQVMQQYRLVQLF